MSRRALAPLLALLVLPLGGCNLSLTDTLLPGGPDLGDHPMHVTFESADTLNLVKQATVKVDDVTVGVVDDISRVGWHAEVSMLVRSDVHLPANTVVAVRQTGLLGEKYVALSAPPGRQVGRLTDGSHIGIDHSARGVELEEVLGALSLLLNGGGIDRLQTISRELHQSLDGREGEFRSYLTELGAFTSSLDRNRQAIADTIDGLDQLSSRVEAGRATIDAALDSVGPALKVLADQQQQLTRMLVATAHLGDVGGRTMLALRTELTANLQALDPLLAQLNRTGDDLPKALGFALTFPFPDNILQAIHGDYVNIDLDVNIALKRTLANEQGGGDHDGGTLPPIEIPTIPGLPPLPGVPTVPTLPALPLPGLPGAPTLGNATLRSWYFDDDARSSR